MARKLGLAALLSLSLIACGGGVRPVGPPSAGTATAPPQVLRSAITSALQRLRMVVVQDEGPSWVCQWGDAQRRGFRFRITFESPGYTVTLIDSIAMHQQVDARSGQMVISSRFHRYISKLHQLVARNLGSQGQATGAVGMSDNQRVIHTGQPIDFGLVQRGLLVSGLQLEQVNAAAGVATTEYRDTGFNYGFIEGETATVHVAYTATLYPTEVRIVQQAQKCAMIWVATGYNNVQQLRCEPMPRGAPGSILSQLDQVATTVEREIRAMMPAQPAQQPAPGPVYDVQPAPANADGVQPAPAAPVEQPVFVE